MSDFILPDDIVALARRVIEENARAGRRIALAESCTGGLVAAALTDIAMLFVRCERGISHNPAERITAADAEAGARVLARFVENFQPAKLLTDRLP